MLNTNLIQKIEYLHSGLLIYYHTSLLSRISKPIPDDISQQLEKISKNSEEEKDTNFNRILFSGRTELQSSTMSKDR